jgi:hypothetical protein
MPSFAYGRGFPIFLEDDISGSIHPLDYASGFLETVINNQLPSYIMTIKHFTFQIFFIVAFCIANLAEPSATFAQSPAPYNGVPFTVPGLIYAEQFDLGGEGVGYHDTDTVNTGGLYRPGEGVDIYGTDDGAGSQYEVGNTKPGEWLQYSVYVTTTGIYSILIRNQQFQNSAGSTIYLEIDGVNVTGPVSLTPGPWNGLNTKEIPGISLSSGPHRIRLIMASTGAQTLGEFNWLYFRLTNPAPNNVPVRIPTPGTQIYYVSPNGSDTNPGTLAQPWKTISKAAETLTAGQTVYVRGGTYTERLIPKNSGTENAYIVYSNYPGELPVISGTGIAWRKPDGLVSIKDARFIRITGFHITNAGVNVPDPSWHFGLYTRNADHIVIDRNKISHTYSLGMTLAVFSSHMLVDGNEVWDHYGDTESTLAALWFANNIEIRNNTVHHSNGEGINAVAGAHDITIHHNTVHDMNTTGSGIGFYSDAWTEWTHSNMYYNNLSYNNSSGFVFSAEAGGLLENIQIFNNVIYSNRNWGINVSKFPWDNQWGSSHPMKNISIINNTVYGNDLGRSGFPGITVENPEATGIIIRNNISSRTLDTNYPLSQLTVAVPANVIISHNLFYGGANNPGTNYIQSNPLFINPTSSNFRLQSGSPAIDNGASIGAPGFDFDSKVRPIGNEFDIGAYEYGTGPTTSPTVIPINTPTPLFLAGDINKDNVVNILDYTLLSNAFGSSNSEADINKDGVVNILDYTILSNNFGKSA